MGVVHLARRADQSDDKQVAIKFVRVDAMLPAWMRADLIARFANERRLLARLDHPHIACILDGGRSEAGVPYLVMAFVDGESPIDYCDRAGLDARPVDAPSGDAPSGHRLGPAPGQRKAMANGHCLQPINQPPGYSKPLANMASQISPAGAALGAALAITAPLPRRTLSMANRPLCMYGNHR